MRSIRRFGSVLTAVTFVWVSSGCAGNMQLAYQSPPPGADERGTISVVMDDQRAPRKGGDDPLVVGFLRNAFGMPFAVKAASNRQPSKVVAQLIAECLEAAGYRVVDSSANAPQLFVSLAEFWSDGYQHNRLWLVAPLELRGAGRSAAVWTKELRINEGWTAKTAGFGQMNSGYNKLLETTRNQLLSEFDSPNFRQSYGSL